MRLGVCSGRFATGVDGDEGGEVLTFGLDLGRAVRGVSVIERGRFVVTGVCGLEEWIDAVSI